MADHLDRGTYAQSALDDMIARNCRLFAEWLPEADSDEESEAA